MTTRPSSSNSAGGLVVPSSFAAMRSVSSSVSAVRRASTRPTSATRWPRSTRSSAISSRRSGCSDDRVEITGLAAGDRDTHIIFVQSLDGLAGVLRVAARYAGAEPLYRRALVLGDRLFEAGDPAMATIYRNLGRLEHARGRYAEGEPYARRSVAIREVALGADHIEVASDLAALAAILDGQGKLEEAEKLYQRALRIFRRSVTVDHPHAVTCARNYADLLRLSGREHDAERLDRRFGGA